MSFSLQAPILLSLFLPVFDPVLKSRRKPLLLLKAFVKLSKAQCNPHFVRNFILFFFCHILISCGWKIKLNYNAWWYFTLAVLPVHLSTKYWDRLMVGWGVCFRVKSRESIPFWGVVSSFYFLLTCILRGKVGGRLQHLILRFHEAGDLRLLYPETFWQECRQTQEPGENI